MIEKKSGGVCAPKGFTASGICAGIKAGTDKPDVALIKSDVICEAAAVYTTNKIKGAPLAVTKEHLKDGKAVALICNSGNANTCVPGGIDVAVDTADILAKELEVNSSDILVASTGVIGEPLSIEPFERGVPELVKELSYTGSAEAAHAIMTTDTVLKEFAVSFEIDGVKCNIGGIAKGSGMIHPNMATMLAFITTDVDISHDMLSKAIGEDVKDSFNQISVDGDTSTNDMVLIMANGLAKNPGITKEGEEFEIFKEALSKVTGNLSKAMAADGEGAEKLIICHVKGASSKELARRISKSVISSNLLKAAIFGEDANWGRVLCAVGYTEGDFDVDKIDVTMASEKGRVTVCKNSATASYDEADASKVLKAKEITIEINMNEGDFKAKAYGCDLTYKYVEINGDYRS